MCEGLGRGLVKDHSPEVGAMAPCRLWLLPALWLSPAWGGGRDLQEPCSGGALGASGPHCFPAWRSHDSCKGNRQHVVSQAASTPPPASS